MGHRHIVNGRRADACGKAGVGDFVAIFHSGDWGRLENPLDEAGNDRSRLEWKRSATASVVPPHVEWYSRMVQLYDQCTTEHDAVDPVEGSALFSAVWCCYAPTPSSVYGTPMNECMLGAVI